MKINNEYANGKQFEIGDRVYIHGYIGTIEKISSDFEETRPTEFKGKRFQQAIVSFDPSLDGIEKTGYNHEAYGTFKMAMVDEK